MIKDYTKKLAKAYKDQFDKENKLEHVSYSLGDEFKKSQGFHLEPDTIQMEWDEKTKSYKNKKKK